MNESEKNDWRFLGVLTYVRISLRLVAKKREVSGEESQLTGFGRKGTDAAKFGQQYSIAVRMKQSIRTTRFSQTKRYTLRVYAMLKADTTNGAGAWAWGAFGTGSSSRHLALLGIFVLISVFTEFGTVFVPTLGTLAVAELGLRVVANMHFDLPPVSLIACDSSLSSDAVMDRT